MPEVFSLTIAITGLFSLFAYSGIPKGRFKKSMFVYYTNISNLILSVYFLLLFLYRITGIGFLSFLENAVVSFSVTMIITMTFLVFHFVLVPYGLKHNDILDEMNIKFGECIIFHYVIPISAILYWFFYADKNLRYPIMSCLWLGTPLVYFIFIMFRAKKGNIEGTKSRFPYPFLDLDRIGMKRFAGNIFMMFVIFSAISTGLYYLI